MEKKHVICLLAFCALLSSCLGCFLEEPAVVLREINFRPRSLTEIELLVGLEVQNSNRFELTLASLEYTVYLNGEKIGNGALEQQVRIAAQSTTRVQVPVKAQFSNWNKSLKTVMTGDGAPYHFEGRAVVRTFWGQVEFPFARSGRINP